jgi:hypothetical protein
VQMSRYVAQQLLGPESWQRSGSCVGSLCGSFWLLRIWQSSPTLPTQRTSPCDFFLFLKLKLKLKRWHFDSNEEIQTES